MASFAIRMATSGSSSGLHRLRRNIPVVEFSDECGVQQTLVRLRSRFFLFRLCQWTGTFQPPRIPALDIRKGNRKAVHLYYSVNQCFTAIRCGYFFLLCEMAKSPTSIGKCTNEST
jgi:hypothetical protein